jgi:hypothetical protein
MSIIPLDVQRRCERRWAAQFSRPTESESVASRNHGPERESQHIVGPDKSKRTPPGWNPRAREGRPKPAPLVGAQSSFLRSIAHDPHVAVRIVASFDHASVREPNESRCGGNECAFVEDRVDLASAAPFAVDYGYRLVVNHGRFRHRIDPRMN